MGPRGSFLGVGCLENIERCCLEGGEAGVRPAFSDPEFHLSRGFNTFDKRGGAPDYPIGFTIDMPRGDFEP